MLSRFLYCLLAVALIFAIHTKAAAAVDDYKTFNIGIGSVSTPLSYCGSVFSTERMFKAYGKNYAISLAHAYCIYINLSRIETDLPSAGADPQLCSDIISTFGPNYYLAIGVQESGLSPNQSGYGYLQIDDARQNLAKSSQSTSIKSYCKFLNGVDHYGAVSGTNVCTSNIIKAYYDAISYQIHSPDIAIFAVNYARHPEFSKPLNIKGHIYYFPASSGMMRLLALYYSRGQWFSIANKIIDGCGNISIESQINYSEGYGGKYIYQIPELYNQFDRLVKIGSVYNAKVSENDMTKYLKSLAHVYKPKVIKAGIDRAKELMHNQEFEFRSHSFYTVMNEVTKAMLEASRI
ncbi:hypothetical protein P0136_13220 [Lentisphaerota bacterium ZTH]|nr:hypothetical protein JYG24_09265 [Lentisphaerota bacterium]WET06319.1 hypothetical protein P0136_13220 [Lentisphaerota bacterium ZTH]